MSDSHRRSASRAWYISPGETAHVVTNVTKNCPARNPPFEWFFSSRLMSFLVFSVTAVPGPSHRPDADPGGTLPVMTTYFVRHRETIGRHVARLYSIHTLGGAACALIGLRADRRIRRGRRGVRVLPGHKPRSAGGPGAPAGAATSGAVIRSRRFRDRRTRRPNCPAYLIAFLSEGGKAQATHRYNRQRPHRERL